MNKDIYKKNMEALQKRFPAIASMIQNDELIPEEKITVEVETAADGAPILRIKNDSYYLYLNGKREPKQTAARVLERWGKLNRATPIYIVGMGNVALMQELLRNTDKAINIMVYEPSLTIFLTLLKEVDITLYFENRALGLVINGINEEEMNGVIKSFLDLANVGFMKSYVCPNYDKLYPKEIVHFLKNLDRISSEIIVGRNTGVRYSSVEADNLFHNIQYLCDGSITTQLCNVIPTDIPAIIVSAGPSLNKNIHELKKAKNHAFIVAVDTAVRPLVNAGIIPDLYVIVDGLKPFKLFDFEEAKRIPLMPSITSAKDVLAHHEGSVSCGGSVACSAFSLVYKLGFSRIILVGQDLALTGNRTHADGTFQDKMDEIDTSHSMMVEGNYEDKVPTRQDFKYYLDWFNYYINGCEGIHVMNATEGGAKIQGTEIITLAEAIERECHREVNLEECFSKLQPIFNEEYRKKAVDYLNTIPTMFRNLKKEAQKGIRYYKKLQNICCNGKLDKTAYLQVLNKIKKITQNLEGHELFAIVSNTLSVADYLITSEQFYEEDNLEAEGLEIARQGIIYLELVKQCIDILIPLTEETVGALQ